MNEYNEKFNKAVGVYLKAKRTNLGLTYKQVGELVGRNKDWYREIERGRNNVNYNDIVSLCDCLDIDIDELAKYAKHRAKQGDDHS